MENQNLEKKLRKGFVFLNRKTLAQREAFYSEAVRFNKQKIQDRIEMGPFEETDYSIKAQNYRHALGQMDRIHTLTLKWLKWAEEDYNRKLEVVAKKLLKFGALEDNITLIPESISENHNRGLDFFIRLYDMGLQDNVGRVHARLTWVSCIDKASHWRFICTLKK